MSHRSTTDKKIRRLRKMIRQPLPVHFDLVQWLKDRGHAQTTREAAKLILDGRVRSGSHVVGTTTVEVVGADGKPEQHTVVDRYQPARYKAELIVLSSS